MADWLSTVQAGTWIALAGWVITAAGWLVSQRAQRKLFIHQVKNSARGELVAALRTEQGVMGELHTTTIAIDVDRKNGLTDHQSPVKWREAFEKYQRIIARSDTQWIFQLEQYEVLFPETARCRLQIVERAIRVNQDVTTFFVGLLHDQHRAAVLQTAPALMNRLSDQAALIEDLLVHVQNATLGIVVGRKVPFRQPPDPTVPRIIVRHGHLTIVDGQGQSESAGR